MRNPDRSVVGAWQRAAGLRAILHVMASICIIATGNSLLTTTISLRLSDPAIHPQVVQALLTAFPIGFLAGCLLARRVVVRFGHERAFLIVTALAALSAFAYMLTGAAPVWFCLRLISGFAIATLFVIAESWVNLYANQKNRGAYFSLYMLTTSLATVFSQLLVQGAGPASPYLFQIVLGLILSGLVYSRYLGGPWPVLPLPAATVDTGGVPPRNRLGLWQLAVLAPVTVVCVFTAGMTNMNVYTMTPIFGERVGFDPAATVGMMTAFSLGGMLAQMPIGWLSDRMDRRVLLLLQGAAGAAVCAAIAWPGLPAPGVMYGQFFAYGAIALTIYPVGIAFANSRIESRFMVSASGSLLLLYSVGNIVTPGIAAELMERFAPQALFLLLGSGSVAVALAACFNLGRRLDPSAAPCLSAKGTE